MVGTAGFALIEGWSLFDSLYMAIITITTVGFSEIHPLSTGGRAFVIVYLFAGIGVFLFGVVQIGEMIVRAELQTWLGRRKMDSALKSVKDHFVICGAGRMGLSVCRHLAEKRLPFVAIDRDEQALHQCRDEEWIALEGDVTDDRTLQEAGIQRARGLATVLSNDADNLYVVLSARLLAPNLQIIARATDEKSAAKMQKAGANRVISVYHTSATKMSQLLVKPDLEDFFEIFTSQGVELDLAEIHVSADGPYTGRTLDETDLSRDGVVIIGIRRANGDLVLPPSGSTTIQADDELIALRRSEAISNALGG
jgi:voltage-gated potassium channel